MSYRFATFRVAFVARFVRVYQLIDKVINFVYLILMYYLQGYTPLHIAMRFRHENVYRLLVEVYGKICDIYLLIYLFYINKNSFTIPFYRNKKLLRSNANAVPERWRWLLKRKRRVLVAKKPTLLANNN